MIRFLIISFLSTYILSSCSLKTTEALRQVEPTRSFVENTYFSNPEIDYVYKAKVKVYNRDFGGILIIKKLGPENHRIVLTTEFGSKLFDFQIQEDVFIKHFAVENFDKKFIINVLEKDFKLLVTERAKVLAGYESDTQNSYKTQMDKGFNFYFLDKKTKALKKIINTSKTKEKVEVNFVPVVELHENPNKIIAETISINHKNIKLSIDLEKFKKD